MSTVLDWGPSWCLSSSQSLLVLVFDLFPWACIVAVPAPHD